MFTGTRSMQTLASSNQGGIKVDSRFIDCQHFDCRHIAKCDSCRQFDCRLIARLSPIITPHPLKKCQNTLLHSGIQMLGWLGLVILFVMQIHLGTHNTLHFYNMLDRPQSQLDSYLRISQPSWIGYMDLHICMCYNKPCSNGIF